MFENITKFDLKLRLDVYKITAIKFVDVILNVLGIVFIVLGLLIFTMDRSFDSLKVSFYGIVIIFLSFFPHWLIKFLIKKDHQKSFFRENNTIVKFKFETETIIEQVIRNEEEFSTTNLKYSDILKVLETDQYILLYIKFSQCLTVNKSGMVLGNVEDLTNFLKTKISKYKIKITHKE